MFILFLLIALTAGCIMGLQGGINAALGTKIGLWEGTFVCMLVGSVILAIIISTGIGGGNIMAAKDVPLWMIIGSGVAGVLPVTAIMASAPKIGIGATMVASIGGQFVFAIIIDQFGLFNVAKVNVDIYRIVGVIIILIGVATVYLGGNKKNNMQDAEVEK